MTNWVHPLSSIPLLAYNEQGRREHFESEYSLFLHECYPHIPRKRIAELGSSDAAVDDEWTSLFGFEEVQDEEAILTFYKNSVYNPIRVMWLELSDIRTNQMHEVIQHIRKLGLKGRALNYGGGAGSEALVLEYCGFDVDYVDVEGEMSNLAEARFKAVGSGVRVNRVSNPTYGSEMPDSWNEQFDLIFSISTMEHVRRPKELMRHFYRVLKVGGIMIVFYHFNRRKSYTNPNAPIAYPQHFEHDVDGKLLRGASMKAFVLHELKLEVLGDYSHFMKILRKR